MVATRPSCTLPVLIGLGAALEGEGRRRRPLCRRRRPLELENTSFRGATEALTGQIAALQAAISDLGGKAALDPSLQSAMDKLPAIVKNRAMGGGRRRATRPPLPALASPENTFGLLRDLLQGIESRLRIVQLGRRAAQRAGRATPSIWPAHGWLIVASGGRSRSDHRRADFHPGLDISADHGTPVYATADGTVSQASCSRRYGNLVVVDHGYGLETRYGHLSAFRTKPGAE